MSIAYPIHPKTLCLLRLSAIGDVSHVLPTLRILQQEWPETKITWVIGSVEYKLVEDIQNVEFIIFEKKLGYRAFIKLHKKLRGRRFDLLLNMQVSPRAAFTSLFIKAPIKLGFDCKRGKMLHNLLVNRRIASIKNQHVLDSFLEFARALGLPCEQVSWNLPVPEAARRKMSGQLPNGPFLAINPCSSIRTRNYRNWSIVSYAKLIENAEENFGLTTVLTGGPGTAEKDYAQKICQQTKSTPYNLVGQTGLKDLLATYEKAAAVIAPDTGPIHLANAIGTPTIGLYATSNPLRTGPYSHPELTVNCYPEALMRDQKKAETQVRWGTRVRDPEAMLLIHVEQVIEKLDLLFSN